MEKLYPINGFEGLYSITKSGKVWSHPNKNHNGKWLKTHINNGGYCAVAVYKNPKRMHKRIHRLLMMTFIPNPENKPQVNHINGIKTDNRLENLEWCTSLENAQHAHRTGLCTTDHLKTDEVNKKRVLANKNRLITVDKKIIKRLKTWWY